MKKLYSSLALFCAIACSFTGFAQTVSGKVYDPANQTLKFPRSKQQAHNVSLPPDHWGQCLSPGGNYDLMTSHPGSADSSR